MQKDLEDSSFSSLIQLPNQIPASKTISKPKSHAQLKLDQFLETHSAKQVLPTTKSFKSVPTLFNSNSAKVPVKKSIQQVMTAKKAKGSISQQQEYIINSRMRHTEIFRKATAEEFKCHKISKKIAFR
ncbi:MAG: hypothetical protein EZS28_032678 [Streblomastix strix]|uniref:Uncharacterized protein n=1 Tax=Streblomastix strix TaxID=222440 RepID=A0A5J4UN03_9EUKA|nr:MAG: hypothetical protein EZS28_032678 [Streblomastix strix]